MASSSSPRRLYFDSDHTCVGSDGYCGDYFASDILSVPDNHEPVGLTLSAIRDLQRIANADRAAAFLARRRAAQGLA